jgi:hypothetical protein
MKILTTVSALLFGAFAMAPEATTDTHPDITWDTSIDDAKARATREGKGIFLLHLFGKLDDELC